MASGPKARLTSVLPQKAQTQSARFSDEHKTSRRRLQPGGCSKVISSEVQNPGYM